MPPAGSRPLTVLERGRLIADCIPFVFLLAGTIVVLTIWSDLTERLTGERTPLVLGAVMGVVLLVTGWIAVKRVRDLLAGSALVAVDTLTRVWRPRRGARGRVLRRLRTPGHARMSARDFARVGTELNVAQLPEPGRDTPRSDSLPYRISYSPASKIAWSLERV